MGVLRVILRVWGSKWHADTLWAKPLVSKRLGGIQGFITILLFRASQTNAIVRPCKMRRSFKFHSMKKIWKKGIKSEIDNHRLGLVSYHLNFAYVLCRVLLKWKIKNSNLFYLSIGMRRNNILGNSSILPHFSP